jgi:hypothetical protein
MNERIRPIREQHGGPGGLDSPFAETESGDRTVMVSSGPYAEELPVGQSTVGEIRRRFRDRFDIDPNGQAILDGVIVDDHAVVRAGQVLAFAWHTGEKGCRP